MNCIGHAGLLVFKERKKIDREREGERERERELCCGERDGFRKRGGSPSRGSVGCRWLKEGGKGAARERERGLERKVVQGGVSEKINRHVRTSRAVK